MNGALKRSQNYPAPTRSKALQVARVYETNVQLRACVDYRHYYPGGRLVRPSYAHGMALHKEQFSNEAAYALAGLSR